MKKLLLLGALFATTAMQAQTTYYWPEKRVSELTSGSQYFIYNTAIDNGDRTWFLYSDGSALKTNNVSPKDFITNDKSFLFETVKPENPLTTNHWYINSAHGILGIGGQTNNTEPRDIYISYWYQNDNILKGNAKSEDEDGVSQDPNSVDTKVWAITKGSDKNPNSGDNSYAWNGNASAAGLGSAWVTWANAHPYAFYSVKSKEISDAASDAYQAILPLISNTYTMQGAFGLIQDASQLSTNAQEQSEGPIANLIDGDDATFFHSSWNNDPSPDAPHYIQVALKEPVKAFYFYMKKRNDSNRPNSIKISTSTDGTNFTELTTISDGLVAAADYMSSKIESANEFNYVRFEVLSTNTKTHFFSLAEFYLLNADYEQVAAVKNSDYIKTTSSEKIESTCTTLKNRIQNVAAYQELQQALKEIESLPWGSGLNQFSKAENFDSAVETAKSITSGSSLESIQSATAELNNLLSSKTINQPETGKFYRFKNKVNNNYLSSTGAAGARPNMVDGSDVTSTVFYLSADKKLTGSNLLNMSNYNFTSDNTGSETSFEASTAYPGCYVIINSGIAYYGVETGKQVDRWGNTTEALAKENCAWTLEEVTETAQQPSLNKTMSAEYATLAAPVALNIPEGVKAYTVTLDEEKATATLKEVSNVIPAGTAVVLKKTSSDSDFTFTFAAEGNTSNTNALTGVYANKEIATDINAYILGNGSEGIGFYQMNADDRTLGANKAYLTLPATVKVRSIIFSDGQTTGIESTIAESTEAEEYYDLQGRRVMNPIKGIYVTKSGKKVVINK